MSGADTRVIGGGFRHINWRCEREVPDCVRGWERDENRGDEENVANGESSSMRGDSTRGYGYWPHQRWEIGRHHGWLRSKHLPMMTCVPAREGWDEHLFADAIFRVIFGRWIHAMI